MRALVIHSPKDLRLEPRPDAEPGPGEVAIRVRAGGVCGSDLHYFHDGGFGDVRLREPMIPGHEVAGEVAAIGGGVENVQPGDVVAINPSLPCLACEYCQRGQHNQCLDMRFYGSAMRFPHVQGAFREHLVCEARQCVTLPAGTDFHHAAFAEPLAVALHGVSRAASACGGLAGRTVLVSGCGPIGTLAVMAARHAGAAEVVATDLWDHVLGVARRAGADAVYNVGSDPGALGAFTSRKGHFDVAIEASGAPAAIPAVLSVVRPRGTVVQLGVGGDVPVPLTAVVAKEICWMGSFRFHEEFAWAAKLISGGQLDVSPLLSETVPVEDAARAFELAGDRSRAVKVQIAF